MTTCKAAWYGIYFVRVCLPVSGYLPKALTYEVYICTSGRVYLPGNMVMFVYEGHPVKVKVTGAKKVKNPYSNNVKF